MTEEAQAKSKVDAAQAFSIGLIEKAWEFKWSLQLIYIALYADAVLAWFFHKNLLSVTISSAQIWESIGALLLAVAGFGLTVSFVIPLLYQLLRKLIFDISPDLLLNSFSERDAGPSEVSIHYVHTEALRTSDDFLMAIYREKNSLWIRRLNDQQQASTLIIGLLLLITTNTLTGYASGTETVILWFTKGYEELFYLCLALISVPLLMCTILKPLPSHYTYHPMLRRKQDQERKELYGPDGITRLG